MILGRENVTLSVMINLCDIKTLCLCYIMQITMWAHESIDDEVIIG